MFKLREFLGLSYYTSKIDKFLNSFRRNNLQLSKTQRAEVEKYKSVFHRRDHANTQPIVQKLWDKF